MNPDKAPKPAAFPPREFPKDENGRINWRVLNHELPVGMEPYLAAICAAGDAKNEMILVGRYQKILRALDEAYTALLSQAVREARAEAFLFIHEELGGKITPRDVDDAFKAASEARASNEGGEK